MRESISSLVLSAARTRFRHDERVVAYGLEPGQKYIEVVVTKELEASILDAFEIEGVGKVPIRTVPALAEAEMGVDKTRVPRATFDLPGTGLHEGAALYVPLPDGVDDLGAAACFVTKVDGTEPTHFLTAAHIFPENAPTLSDGGGTPIRARTPNLDYVVVGYLETNLIDLGYETDVAVIEMTNEGRQLMDMSIPGVLPLAKIGVDEDEIIGQPAQIFSAIDGETRQAPDLVHGWCDVEIPDRHRGRFWVQSALATRAFTNDGESGTALASGMRPYVGFGLLTGIAGRCAGIESRTSVFQSLARGLNMLKTADRGHFKFFPSI